MMYSYSDAAEKFLQMAIDLKAHIEKAKANQKIFKLSTSQFYTFSKEFANKYNGPGNLTEEMSTSLDKIGQYQIEIGKLIELNFGNKWSTSAMNNCSSYFPAKICSYTKKIHEEAKKIDPDLSTIFDYSSPQWRECHSLDIQSIRKTFNAYITKNCGNQLENMTPQAQKMIDRINSFDDFLTYFSNNSSNSEGLAFSVLPLEYGNIEITEDDLIFDQKIGEGTSAVVHKGRLKSTGEQIAIKVIKKDASSVSDPMMQDLQIFSYFNREIKILPELNHSRILKLIGVSSQEPYIMATEWLGGGELFDAIKKYSLNGTQSTIIAFDLARAMFHVHQYRVIHRDIKSMNILLDDDGFIRLCDFGMARKISSVRLNGSPYTGQIGTGPWMAPELMMNTPYDAKVDVYAYGITLWEMVAHSIPFNDVAPQQLVESVVVKNRRPPMPSNVPPALENLITSCWAPDPNERPSSEEILALFSQGSIFFEDADTEAVMKYIHEKIAEETSWIEASIHSLETKQSKTLSDVFDSLRSIAIIPEFEERCWTILQSVLPNQLKVENEQKPLQREDCDYSIISQLFALFISTEYRDHAIIALSRLPKVTVDSKTIQKLTQLDLKSNENLNEMIIRIFYKSGHFEDALLRATKQETIILLLELLARNPERVTKKHINDILINCQTYISNSSNIQMTTSAVTCLISIIQYVLNTQNTEIKINDLENLFTLPFIQSITTLCKNQMIQQNESNENKKALTTTILYFGVMNLAGLPFVDEIFDALFSGVQDGDLINMIMIAALRKNDVTCSNFINWVERNKEKIKNVINSDVWTNWKSEMEKNSKLGANSKRILESLCLY